MKKLLFFVLALVGVLVACNKYDDTKVWEELNDHEARISSLEKLCREMNTNIASLQSIVTAIQNNDYVMSVTPVKENGKEVGYTLKFSKTGDVTIYHGKDGQDGDQGQPGQNGQDGKEYACIPCDPQGNDGVSHYVGPQAHQFFEGIAGIAPGTVEVLYRNADDIPGGPEEDTLQVGE
jgi:hypothetical protein